MIRISVGNFIRFFKKSDKIFTYIADYQSLTGNRLRQMEQAIYYKALRDRDLVAHLALNGF